MEQYEAEQAYDLVYRLKKRVLREATYRNISLLGLIQSDSVCTAVKCSEKTFLSQHWSAKT